MLFRCHTHKKNHMCTCHPNKPKVPKNRTFRVLSSREKPKASRVHRDQWVAHNIIVCQANVGFLINSLVSNLFKIVHNSKFFIKLFKSIYSLTKILFANMYMRASISSFCGSKVKANSDFNSKNC